MSTTTATSNPNPAMQQVLGNLKQNVPKLKKSPYFAPPHLQLEKKDKFEYQSQSQTIPTSAEILSAAALVEKALLKIPGVQNLNPSLGKPLSASDGSTVIGQPTPVIEGHKGAEETAQVLLPPVLTVSPPKKTTLSKKRKENPNTSTAPTPPKPTKKVKVTTNESIIQPPKPKPSPQKEFTAIPFDKLYPKDLTQVTLNQYGYNTCYFLAWLDSVLHHPQGRQILERIGISENDTAYKVKFPGQATEIEVPKRLMARKSGYGVRSNFEVIRILERAYLQIPGARAGDFDESIDALNRVFEDKEKEKRTKTKTTQEIMMLNDRNAGSRVLLKVVFDKATGNFMTVATAGHPARPITPADMIDSEAQGLRDKIAEARVATRPMALNLEVLDDYKNARGAQETRHKFLLPDHFIGPIGILHEERKDKLQEYIRTALDNHRNGRPLDLDILTAIRTRRGGHYYSVRLLDSTPTQIILANPGDTATDIRRVPIDDFLRDYNLTGIRLSPNP